MKKIIGVAAILLTLVISIIYRQLTGSLAKFSRPKRSVPALVHEVRENLLISSLMIQ
jgi:hypothetical protein